MIPTLEVFAGQDSTVCLADGAVDLGGFTPEGGRWNGPGIPDSRLPVFDPSTVGDGTYQLVYTVGNAGCVVRDTLALTVVAPLQVSAGPALNLCPSDRPVELTGASPEGGRWSGPGVRGGSFDPGSVEPGNYKLAYSLTENASGCVANAERRVTVHPRPRAVFSTPAAACVDESLDFPNQSLGASSYRWDFGDGSTSARVSPTHTYEDGGVYDVALITTNDFGCSDTLVKTLDIGRPPEALFLPDVDEGCSVLEVTFDNRSAGEGAAYQWDFGNGQVSASRNPGPVAFS